MYSIIDLPKALLLSIAFFCVMLLSGFTFSDRTSVDSLRTPTELKSLTEGEMNALTRKVRRAVMAQTLTFTSLALNNTISGSQSVSNFTVPRNSTTADSGLRMAVTSSGGDGIFVSLRNGLNFGDAVPSGADQSLQIDTSPGTTDSQLGVITFTSDDGTEFQLDSFVFGSTILSGSVTASVQAYRDGAMVGTAVNIASTSNSAGDAQTGNQSVVFGVDFENIDEFRVTVNQIADVAFDDFVITSIPNNAPVIGGASSGQAVNDNATVDPFSAITITDADGDNVTATITLDGNAKGTLSGTDLSGSGPYTISSKTPAAMQTAIRALTFTPTANRTATTETTTFTITINDGTVDTDDANSTVISSAVGPTITAISIPNTAMKVGDVVTATITVSSDTDDYTSGSGGISGTIGDFALGSLSRTNATTYTATFTVSNGGTDVLAGSDIPVSVTLTDSGGKAGITFGTGISQANDTIDANNPSVTNVSIPNSASKIGDAVTVSITAGEAGLSLNTGTVNGVTVTGFTDNGGGSYSTTYTVTDGNTDRAAGDDIPVNFILNDAAGNSSTAFTTAISQASDAIDANSPLVTNVTIPNAAVKVGDAVTVTITASEAGLSLTDGVLNEIQVTGFTDNGGGSYSATYTVAEGNTDRAAGDAVPVGFVLSDPAGNVSATFTTAISQNADAIDANSPSITNVTIPNSAVKIGDAVTVTITASEAGLSLNTGTVNGVTVTGFTDNGGGSYSATYTVVDGNTDRASGDDIPVSFVLVDPAGNVSATFNTAISQNADAIDANSPSINNVTIPNSAAKIGDAISVSITASEAGLSLTDGVLNGVQVTGFTDNGGGSYTATYTVVDGNTDRAAGADIPISFVLSDPAGNVSATFNTAISQNADAIDANSPTITNVTIPNSGVKIGDVVSVSITAGEAGLSLTDGVFNGVQVTDFTDNGGGSYTGTYTVAEGNTDRATGADIPISFVLSDPAGNVSATFNTAISQNADAIDANSPALNSIVVADQALKSGETTLVTFTFSEVVTGFTNADITIPNGTMTDVSSADGGTTYTATFTPTADLEDATNIFTVDKTGVTDNAGNPGVGTTDSGNFTIDTKKPAVTITSDASDPQSGAFTATFTFSEDVTGFVLGDITVGNGAASNFNATSATVYTATITPAADGATTVDVAADKANDSAGNGNTAATQLSVTNDETKPTVAITSSADPTSGAFTAIFTFSEDVSGFAIGDITVGNGAASNFQTTSASVYIATITPAVDGATTVDVAPDKATDAAGNGNTAATQLSVTNDETKPTVTITSTNTSGFALGEFPVTITFNESVTGFVEGDITLSNGTVKVGTFSGTGTTYNATITGTNQGSVTVDVAADKANDAAGNGNTAATQFSIENDVISPSVTITSDAASPQSGAFTAIFTFNEAVNNFVIGDITVGNGAASNFNVTSTSVYTATITPTADGNVSIDVPLLAANDIAGNLSNAATQLVIVNDETKPTVTITASANPTSGAFTATFTFSEDVTGFSIEDITVGNGVASNFQTTSASVYTAMITPAADGATTVDVAADKASDAAGNGNTAATQLSVTNDETKPTVTITASANPTSGAFTATFTFSEDVAGFVIGDITIGNGAASNFQTTSASVYTATITPAGDEVTTVDVAADKASDAAGNGNTAATQLSVTNDETKPTVTITASANPTSGAFTATFIFSEDVTGFVIGDITIGNGVASNFQAASASVYTATITPAADGATTVDVAADKANDAAGNGNTAATQLSVTNDETKPTVTLSASTTNPVNGKFSITAEFSEGVSRFIEGDITTDGTISDFVVIDAKTYTFSISSAGVGATVDVAEGVASDAAGNSNVASNSLILTFDITPPDAPTVDLADASDSGSSNSDNLTNDNTPTIQGTAEANSTVEVFDGATRVGSTNADGSGNWSLTPSSSLAEGSHSITAKATDVANNRSVASNPLSITIDTTSPLIPSIDGISDDNGSANFDFMTNDNTLVFNGTAEANASVELFIDETSIGSTSTNGSGNFSFDHSNTTLSDNSYTVTSKATDASGNTSESSTASTLVIDTTLPTPTLSVIGSSLTNTSFTVTFEYDEMVTGFELGDISVTNGTASNFTNVTAGTKWTADITPSSDGTVSVALASGVATDTPGNSSAAGNTVSKAFDGTAPTVNSINRKSADQLNTTTSSADFRVTFSEDVSGVDATDFETVTTGSATGSVGTVTQVDAKTYDVTVSSISGEGTIGLNAKDDDSVTDNAGNPQNGNFTGQVYTTNFAPTAIGLSPNSISENNEVGATVGALSSTDADGSDTHSYSLISGTGDADNGSFTIDGTNLKAQISFDFETKSSYSIRVKSQDSNGGSFEQSLTITIDNVLEPSVTITGEVSFPTSALGLSQQLPLTITNNGEISVEVRAISTPSGFSVLPGSFVLEAGTSREVSVVFVPTEVRAYSGNITFGYGEFVVSHLVSGEGAIITSVDDDLIDADEISLYPNPTATELNIDLSQLNGKELDIVMRNVSGVAVYERKSYAENRLSLNVQRFKSGLYIMQFSDSKSVIRKKVMIKK